MKVSKSRSTGEMRERVLIQKQTQSVDDYGAFSTIWIDIDEFPNVWARVSQERSNNNFVSEKNENEAIYNIVIRYRSDVDEKMRIVWRGKFLAIDSILNVDERRRYLELLCSEAR